MTIDFPVHLVETIDDLMDCKRWLSQRQPALAVDTETEGLHFWTDQVRLVQIGWTDEAWAIPWHRWSGAIFDILGNWDRPFVFHNAKFDVKMLEYWANDLNYCLGFRLPRHMIHDTCIMANIIDPSKSVGLKPLSARYLDASFTSDESALTLGMSQHGYTWATVPLEFPPYWVYGSSDVVRTARLFEKLYPMVMQDAPQAYELEMGTTWALLEMERKGVEVDTQFAGEAHDRLMGEIDDLKAMCHEKWKVGPTKNQDVINVLKQETDYEFTKLTDGGGICLDKEVLTDVVEVTQHPLALAVADVRRKQKICASYLRRLTATGFHSLVDGNRIHPSFNGNQNYGARTGRMSVSDPPLQQLPRAGNPDASLVRQCFTATNGGEDHRLVLCDFDQIEARIFASLCRDPALIAAFSAEEDFFTTVARMVYSDPTIKKSDPRRQVTKNTVYSCVTTDSEILTTRGWLNYAEIQPGDYTQGFDKETREIRWTKITAVNYYPSAPTVQMHTDIGTFTTTPNHRWLRDDDTWVETEDIKPYHSLRVDAFSYINGSDIVIHPGDAHPVWCPTTELGTWTMRQDGAVVVTGNSLYGAGNDKIAQTAGVSVEVIDDFMTKFDQMYPGKPGLIEHVIKTARQRHETEGVAYVRSLIGKRKLPADTNDKAYVLLNYLIQGTAAEVLKKTNIKLHRAGLGDYLVLNVHDEVILDVPNDLDPHEVAKTVQDIVTDDTLFEVPLTAGSDVTWCWGVKGTEFAGTPGIRSN